MTRHYCTYFDQNYLVRGLTLYRSLARHDDPFVLWVLCLDDASHATLERLAIDNLRPVRLAELERADPGLVAAKRSRSRIEYYFTLSPAWPLYLLRRFPEIDLVTYVDSDLHFYSSPEPIYRELGSNSVLVIGHRFPDHLRHLEVHGIYNVGFLVFRNDEYGLARLEEWRDQCLDWCYDRLEPGRFADQKYLDPWPDRRGVHVLQHKGAGLAPWNWVRHDIAIADGAPTVDGDRLIFFHFHGLKVVNRWFFQPSESGYDRMPRALLRHFYGGYLRDLSGTREWVRSRVPDAELSRSASVRYAQHTFRDTLYWLRRGELYTRPGFVRV